MNQKGFSSIILTAILAIVIIALGLGYLIAKKPAPPTPSPSSSFKDETADIEFLKQSPLFSGYKDFSFGPLSTAVVFVEQSNYGPPFDPGLYQLAVMEKNKFCQPENHEGECGNNLFVKSRKINLKEYLGKKIEINYKVVKGIIMGEQQLIIVDEIKEVKTPDETAGWKTYKNEKYGFEVQYPQNLRTEQPVSDVFIVYNSNMNKNEYLQIQWLATGPPFKFESGKEPVGYKPNGAEYVGRKVLDGREFIKYHTDNPLYKKENDLPFTSYVIKLGDKEWVNIEYHAKDMASNLFEKIISTFKFIEKDKTADWKVYGSDKYGYEIKYPRDWKVKEGSSVTYFYPATNESVSGFDPDIFISANKEPYTLAFQGTWAEIPYSAANSSQFARSENTTTNGIAFKKDYWLIRAAGEGEWMADITFNAKHGDKYYSLSRGLTIKVNGLPGAPYSGKDIKDAGLIAKAIEVINNSDKSAMLGQIASTFRFTR